MDRKALAVIIITLSLLTILAMVHFNQPAFAPAAPDYVDEPTPVPTPGDLTIKNMPAMNASSLNATATPMPMASSRDIPGERDGQATAPTAAPVPSSMLPTAMGPATPMPPATPMDPWPASKPMDAMTPWMPMFR